MDNKSKVWLIVLAFLMIAALTMCVVFKLKLDDVSDKYEAVVAAAEATPSVTVVSTEAAVTPDATGTEEPTAEPVDATDEPASATEEPVFSGYTLDEVEQMALDLEQARAHEAELEAEVATLQAEIDAYEADADGDVDAETRIEAMKAENEVLAAKVDVLKEDNAVLTSDLEYANAEKNALAAELEAVNAENQQLSGDLDAANTRISTLEAEMAEFRNEGDVAAVSYIEDAVNVDSDGVSAQYNYTCTAPEGGTSTCSIALGEKELYTSGEMKAGDVLEGFELTEALAAGTYEGVLTVTTCRADGSVASRITLPVTIVVAE